MTERIADSQQLAEACVELMLDNDAAARSLGVKVLSVAPGQATLSMRVSREMTNSHLNCHGGVIFTLADVGFAYACNNANKMTVASGCTIEYMAPAAIGDTLTATVIERSRSGRTGVYDADITNQRDELVAVFRGKSYQIRGEVIPQPGE